MAASSRRKGMGAAKRQPKRAKDLGISTLEYLALLTEQAGGCAICGATPKRLKNDGTPYRLHVDHERPSGRVRGLLCYRCNSGLRSYMDAEWLLRAAAYMKQPR